MKKLKKIKSSNLVIPRLRRHILNDGPRHLFIDDSLTNTYRQNIDSKINEINRHLDEIEFNVENIFNSEGDLENDHDEVMERPHKQKWLGSYRGMRSPGMITFYERNLNGFFWYIIKELLIKKHFINSDILEDICENVIKKTHYHELFHHYSDFMRIYTDGRARYDFEDEEALAVAFSRIYLGIENNNLPIYTDFFKIAYRYKSRGYKDWVKYQNESDFLFKLIDYSAYQSRLATHNMGNLFEICQEFLEVIVNNPNVEYQVK